MKNKVSETDIDLFVVAPGVWGMKDVFVNVYMILNAPDNNWVLVDAGLKWSAVKIKRMAELLFGRGSKPSAIVLTHGHFDHVGSLKALAEEWDVPVYAHHLEMPFLTGIASYPPPDPTVGGGLMAEMSFMYPRGPINIEDRVISLPQSGMIPGLPEWKYLHTPGHAPGHISLFRESDKVLIAGDAIVTTKQESALSVMMQTKILSGPPKYFTCDWPAAYKSVSMLADLEPEIIAAGHGRPMRGESMRKSLYSLKTNFDSVALPAHGRYVYEAAITNDNGVIQLPPPIQNGKYPVLKVLGITAGVLLTILLLKSGKKEKNKAGKSPLLKQHKKIKLLQSEYNDAKESALDALKKLAHAKKKEEAQTKKAARSAYSEAKPEYEDVKKGLTNSWDDAGKKAGKAYKDVKQAAKSAYKEEDENAIKSWDDTGVKGGKALKDVKQAAKSGYKDMKENVSDTLDDAGKKAGKAFKDVKQAAKLRFKDEDDDSIENWDNTNGKGSKAFKDVKQAVKLRFKDEDDDSIENWDNNGGKSSKAFKDVKQAATAGYKDAGKYAKEEYEDAKTAVKSTGEHALESVKSGFDNLKQAAVSNVKDAGDYIKSEYQDVKHAAQSRFGKAEKMAKHEYRDIRKAAKSNFRKAGRSNRPGLYKVVTFGMSVYRIVNLLRTTLKKYTK